MGAFGAGGTWIHWTVVTCNKEMATGALLKVATAAHHVTGKEPLSPPLFEEDDPANDNLFDKDDAHHTLQET